MGIGIDKKVLALVAGGVGVIAALMWGAPTAMADPDAPVPPPAPVQVAAAELPPPPPPAPFDPLAFLHPAPPPDAPADVAPAPAAAPLSTPPDGMPHLASPDALPPGATMDPSAQSTENPNVSYLKDLWHAVQNQEISGKQAVIMGLAQRGMNTPIPEQAAGPNVPVSGANLAPATPPAPGIAPPPPADAPPPPPAPALPSP